MSLCILVTLTEQFIKDVGFQRWILEKCGIKVVSCFVVYHGEDENNPFVIKDVSQEARSYVITSRNKLDAVV